MIYKDEVKKIVTTNCFKKLEKYVSLIEKYNQKYNLTNFQKDTLWKEGIYESIITFEKEIKYLKLQDQFLDIGSGAGFPSIPLLIYKNNKFHLTIYEINIKKYLFLKHVIQELNLNAQVFKKRVEEVKQHEKFNFITARAVTNLKKLILMSYHLGKVNCYFYWIKGPLIKKEIQDAQKIIHILNLKYEYYKIQDQNLTKQIYLIKYIKKTKAPQKFPWSWQKINRY